MKKTLIVSLEYPPQIGGIATYVHDLANALPSQDVVVLAPSEKNSAEWDKQQKYKIIRSPLLYKIFWPRWLKLYFVAKKIVKQEKIELVVLHHILPVGYIAHLLKKIHNIPYLIFSHGTDVAVLGSMKDKRKKAMQIARGAEQIVVNSESLKQRLLKVFPEFGSKTTVLYPCPDNDFFTPPSDEELEKMEHLYALEGKKVILTVSRMAEGKGFPLLINHMSEVLKKVPNLVWMIVGDGPKREEIFDLIQKSYLQNIVRYMGEVPHAEIKKYYYLADIFILLTHPDKQGREEGLGLVFLEAAATSLPTVAGRSGGVEEAVLHSKTGLVVDAYNTVEVTSAISEFINNPEFAEQMGANARKRVEEQFHWSEQLKKIQQWIQ